MSEKFLNNWDILKGVGELVVDEAKLVIKAVFRMPHQLASHGEHDFKDVHPPEPPRLPLWDSEGCYYDGDDTAA